MNQSIRSSIRRNLVGECIKQTSNSNTDNLPQEYEKIIANIVAGYRMYPWSRQNDEGFEDGLYRTVTLLLEAITFSAASCGKMHSIKLVRRLSGSSLNDCIYFVEYLIRTNQCLP